MAAFRVMSYNIRFDCPTDGPFRWQHRSSMVASMLQFHHVDIVGMQEVLRHQLLDLARDCPDFDWIGVGREDGKDIGEYVPILYNKNKFTLQANGHFWLSETPSTPGSKSWGTACTRVTTWGLFELKGTMKNVLFVNTHLDHMSETARTEGIKLIRHMITSEVAKLNIPKENLAIILVGDMNATESSVPIEWVTKELKGYTAAGGVSSDAPLISLKNAKFVSKYPHHGPTGTFTGFKFEVKPPILIDYIFVNNNVLVDRHGVLTDTFDDNYPPSDHRPIVCDVHM